jgi:hypothetical protein
MSLEQPSGASNLWALAPILPYAGAMVFAAEGYPRRAVLVELVALITDRRSGLLHADRAGPVLYCTPTAQPQFSVNEWLSPIAGHAIVERPWFGDVEQLISLIEEAPSNTAAVFVEAHGSPAGRQVGADTFKFLDLIARRYKLPLVLIVDSDRRSSDPLNRVPIALRGARHLTTLVNIEQDEEGGVLLETFLLLVLKSELWTPWAGISLSLALGPATNAAAPLVHWREFLAGDPVRLAKDAKAGNFAPAVRRALDAAKSLLAVPMASSRLWDLLQLARHADYAIEKALTRGKKRGVLATAPVRNPDGTVSHWMWRLVVPPWPFPTSGTATTPAPNTGGQWQGVGGVAVSLPDSLVRQAYYSPMRPSTAEPTVPSGHRQDPPESEPTHPESSLYKQVVESCLEMMSNSTFDSTCPNPKRAVVEDVLGCSAPNWSTREDIIADLCARLPNPD